MRTLLRNVSVLIAAAAVHLPALANPIHVATNGKDHHPGTPDKPMASLQAAVNKVAGKDTPQEIILHPGVYKQGFVKIPAKANSNNNEPLLTIRAAKKANGDYEAVVFDGGQVINEASPVAGKPGVFTVHSDHHHLWFPSVWELDTRTRYTKVADEAAVYAFPGTFTIDYGRKLLTFHTSDSQSYKAHEMGMSGRWRDGIRVTRSNVLIQGLSFHNFHVRNSSVGILLNGANQRVEDCHVWNSTRGFMVGDNKNCVNAQVVRCTAEDVSCGFFSYGDSAAVTDCRFICHNDAFQVQIYNQNHAGIEYYHPAKNGTILRNLVVGFAQGIFLKGNKGKVVIENNTSVCGPIVNVGIGTTHWEADCISRYNIVVGHSDPLVLEQAFGDLPHGMIVDHNCFWKADTSATVTKTMQLAQSAGTGRHNIYADPLFAAPEQGDYRLLPESPCATLAPGGKPIGALGVVAQDFRDTSAPTVTLSAAQPAKVFGATTKSYNAKDNWKGAVTEEYLRTTFEAGAGNTWTTPSPLITLRVTAEDNFGTVDQMTIKVGDKPWQPNETIAYKKAIKLPTDQVDVRVQVKVRDQAGNWSKPAAIRFIQLTTAPSLAGPPHSFTNDHGFIVSFHTETPCYATLAWGEAPGYDHIEARKPDERRWWDTESGEWIDYTTAPRTVHHFSVLAPRVQTGKTYQYRLTLDNGVGNRSVIEGGKVTIQGPATTRHVAPSGVDAQNGGTMEAPWQTLQYAVDRALPGDRVVLAEGLYPGETLVTHGGLKGAPITIAAAEGAHAVLDGGKEVSAVLRLNDAPHVVITGLEIRWAKHYCMYITRSPHATVSRCTVWSKDWATGRNVVNGLLARDSPGLALDRNTFFSLNSAMRILKSPNFTMTNNTALKTIHRIAIIVYSTHNSVCRNNSLTFGGNENLDCYETAADWATFDCDYNNFAMRVRGGASRRRVQEELPPFKGDFFRGDLSKGINSVRLDGQRPFRAQSLKEWQERAGKDANSIITHPLYADPVNRDFRLLPDSPNIGAGEGGTTIGALGPVTMQ